MRVWEEPDEGGGPSDGSVGLSGRDAEGVLSAAKPGQFGNSYRLVLSLALSFFFFFFVSCVYFGMRRPNYPVLIPSRRGGDPDDDAR